MVLNVTQIQEILPHRYPFLLVDRIDELVEGKRAVGIKNVTANENFFQGHFPGNPVMPGVLIVEALAQVGAIIVLGLPENRGRIAYFAAIDKLRIRRSVVPGDQLKLDVEITKLRSSFGRGFGRAFVGDELAVEGELTFALGPKPTE